MKKEIDFEKLHRIQNKEIGFYTCLTKVQDIIDEEDDVVDIKIAINKLTPNFD